MEELYQQIDEILKQDSMVRISLESTGDIFLFSYKADKKYFELEEVFKPEDDKESAKVLLNLVKNYPVNLEWKVDAFKK